MKILLTGSSGFLGCNLIKEVKTIYKLIITSRYASSKNNYNDIIWKSYDLFSEREKFYDYDYFENPDTIIHFAWYNLPNYNSNVHTDQVDHHYSFLESMIKAGVKNLFVLGTCQEYGMQSGELSEDMVVEPVTNYGIAKNNLRIKLETLKKNYSFNLNWIRLFYVYGEGQPEGTIWTSLQNAILNNEKTFKMSIGDQIRDYLPISSVSKSILGLLKKNQDLGIVNICSNQPTSIVNIVQDWIKENQWKIELELGYYPKKDYEPFSFWGSNKKMLKILNI